MQNCRRSNQHGRVSMPVIIALMLLAVVAIGIFVSRQSGGEREVKVVRPKSDGPVTAEQPADDTADVPEPALGGAPDPYGYIRIVNDSGFTFGNAKNLHAAEYACQQVNVVHADGLLTDSDKKSKSKLERCKKIFFQGGPFTAGPLAQEAKPGLRPGAALNATDSALIDQLVKSWDMDAYGTQKSVFLQSSLPPGARADALPPSKFYSGMMILPRQPRPASNSNPIYFKDLSADDSGKSRDGTLADFLGLNLEEITRVYAGSFQYIELSKVAPDTGFMDSGRMGLAKLLADTDKVFEDMWQAWEKHSQSGDKDGREFLRQWMTQNAPQPPPPIPPLVDFVNKDWLAQSSHHKEEFALEAFATKQALLSWMDKHPPLSAEGNTYYDSPNVGGQNSFHVKNLQRVCRQLTKSINLIDPDFKQSQLTALLSSVQLPMGSEAYIYRAGGKGPVVMAVKGDPKIKKEAPWIESDARALTDKTTPYYGRRLVMFQWLINRSNDWNDKRQGKPPMPASYDMWSGQSPNYQNVCVHDKFSWTPGSGSSKLKAELKLQSFFGGCGDLTGAIPPEQFPCIEERCKLSGPT